LHDANVNAERDMCQVSGQQQIFPGFKAAGGNRYA
jgi:hypothetical protein